LKRFENRVVLVTGGGGGIGSETCRRFAAEGARVAVADMNLASAQAVADHLAASGAQALAVACDITQRAQVDLAIAKVESELGAIDVLVNNAGWDVFKPFTKTVESEWERLISINLVGALHMHHAVLPSMVQRRAGRIINIASDAARVGSSGEAVYAACKGGLVSFSKTIAREHARHGITVNVVCPGPTQTALFEDYKQGAGNPEKLLEAFQRAIPLGRIGQPSDLPGAILFFASDDASYVTGQVISVSGGLTMNG
jgi:2-hydroxycyclohexanecarboxyl-CoA dehydrogenase